MSTKTDKSIPTYKEVLKEVCILYTAGDEDNSASISNSNNTAVLKCNSESSIPTQLCNNSIDAFIINFSLNDITNKCCYEINAFVTIYSIPIIKYDYVNNKVTVSSAPNTIFTFSNNELLIRLNAIIGSIFFFAYAFVKPFLV